MEFKGKKSGAVLLISGLLLVALVLIDGCKKSEPGTTEQTSSEMSQNMAEPMTPTDETMAKVAAATEQTTCPVMDGNKIDKNIFVEYKGKKVYFCCASCKAKFEADPEKYIAKLPQFQK